MKKTLKKLTNVTLATTLTVGPTVMPFMIHAEELDSSTIREQVIKKTEGPTLENEQLLNKLENEQESFSEEQAQTESNQSDSIEDETVEQLLIENSEKEHLTEKEGSDETPTLETGSESSNSTKDTVIEQPLTEKELLEETSILQTPFEQPNLIENEVVEQTVNSFVLSDWTYSEDANSITLTKYNGKQTSLYVPGEYLGKQIIIRDFKIFPSSMTHLQLEEIDGQKVGLETTSLFNAFGSNTKILSLDLSGLDTSNVTNMSRMFYYATKLTTLDVSGWNTSNVIDMSSMFRSTRNITTLDLSHFDTSNVINMSYMFCYAEGLTFLDLNNWNTSSVTQMSYMFSNASGLTTLEIGDWDTSNVITMRGMFEKITQLTTLDVSQWDVSSVTDMELMFSYASSLTTLDVSQWDVSSVTDMELMFSHVLSLTTLDVSQWDVSNVVDMERLFLNMASLQSLDLSKWNVANVRNMEKMFAWLPQINVLDLSSWEVSENTKMSKMFDVGVDIQAPLLVITKDSRLKSYSYAKDYRTASRITYLTNGGQFADGSTEFQTPEFFTVESAEDSYLQSFISRVEAPAKEGYWFKNWELVTTVSGNTPAEEVYQRLNGTYQATWRLPNAAPVIEAEDVTIYEGDSFNPLDYASAMDEEDGPITLTESNVIFNDVDPSTPGIYQVTYEVTDQDGATVSKTITVTVLKKEVVELPETDTSTDDTNDDAEKPTPPTTEKPNEPSIEKPTDKPTEKPSMPTTDHQQPNGTNQETIETGFTNFAMLFVGLFACLQGLMVWKHKK